MADKKKLEAEYGKSMAKKIDAKMKGGKGKKMPPKKGC